MDAEIILIKAHLSSVYCASDELFADLAKLDDISFPQVLKLFAVWHHWYVRRYLAAQLQKETLPPNQEELLCRQTVRHEYHSLHFDFMNKFRFYVPKEEVVMAYIERLQSNPIHYAKGVIVMKEFLRYMYSYRIFDEATTMRLSEAHEKALHELEKL